MTALNRSKQHFRSDVRGKREFAGDAFAYGRSRGNRKVAAPRPLCYLATCYQQHPAGRAESGRRNDNAVPSPVLPTLAFSVRFRSANSA